jgi:Undecaprenyl-phosphate glucose phosphotransferase
MNTFDPDKRYKEAMTAARPASGRTRRDPVVLSPLALEVAKQFRTDTMSPVMVAGVIRLLEFTLLALGGMAAYFVQVGFHPQNFWQYPLIVIVLPVVTVIMLELAGCYQMSVLRNPLPQVGRMLLVWSAAFSVGTVALFFLKVSTDFSRLWVGSWYILGFALMLGLRFTTARFTRRWARNGRMERRAVIVGGGTVAEDLIRQIEQQPYNDIRICGIFDDRDDVRSPPVVAGYPKLGNTDELVEFARLARIDLMIVTIPITAEARVLSMLRKLWVLPIDIRLSAHSNHLRFRPRAYSYIGAVPMLDVFDRPINDWDKVAKRIFDVAFSLLGIIVFSPLMLATAIAIKLDTPGPVLFKQKRHGFNNEVIEVFKFRSMYTDQCDPTARNPVQRGDPRVTRVGRFIRRTSIDELPQFFNSLRGSLSLVGPRPHAIAAEAHNRLFDEVVDGYFARHRVKPGVTGWAQINGWRGELDTEEKIRKRIEFDLYYIENWSLWFDLKILFMTPVRLLGSENAY